MPSAVITPRYVCIAQSQIGLGLGLVITDEGNRRLPKRVNISISFVN